MKKKKGHGYGEEDEATIGFRTFWARKRRDPKTRGQRKGHVIMVEEDGRA